MRRPVSTASPGSHYRRGAVMGLTVAEAFMLVAFVLLMLMLFWRHQVQDDVAFAKRIPPNHREALSNGAVPVSPKRLEELEGKERRFEDMARRVPNDDELVVRRERLGELEKADELRKTLDPYGEYGNEALIDRIRALQKKVNAVDSRLAREAQERRRFTDRLKDALSDLVKGVGGEIGPGGRITFPDKAFFEKGSAEIPPRSRKFLDDICSRWLAILKKDRDRFNIAEIRIEGHSSSEWADAQTERDAWVENLHLSQQRAQSVLVHCLNHVGQTPLGKWARERLTAVGYSSSRHLTADDGSEDKDASRRVVLGYDVSRAGQTSHPGDVGSGGVLGPIRGKAQTIDADTIRIGKTAIRLDGVDAPERKQTCARNDDSEWPCGREAGQALERRIGGGTVECDRLNPDLMGLRGKCRIVGESEDLNRWVVRSGWAFAYVRFSTDYASDQARARKARRGIWSGRPPLPPWEWRRQRTAAGRSADR